MSKNYQNGKIYRVYCLAGEDGDEYIGSTCRDYLCQRWSQHKAQFTFWKQGKGSKCNSYDLFNKYGLENCIIELLEEYPCENIEQLNRKEGEYIKQRKCVNRCVAGQTPAEYHAIPENKARKAKIASEYYAIPENKAHKAKTASEYRATPEYKAYRAKYNTDNKERINELSRIRRQKDRQG